MIGRTYGSSQQIVKKMIVKTMHVLDCFYHLFLLKIINPVFSHYTLSIFKNMTRLFMYHLVYTV